VAEISAKAVKELREKTGAGMMDCKHALSEAGGDVERAVEVLRERGLAKAGKREGRATSEGGISICLAGNVGGMVEVGCETDFVARTDDFMALGEMFAAAVVADASVVTPEALSAVDIDGETVSARVTASISRLGENITIKRVARLEGSGTVGGYVHAGGKLGVLVALDGGADEALSRDVAMHVAAADPTPVSVDKDGVSSDFLDKERAIYKAQAVAEGKPEKVVDRIVEGKVQKYLKDVCLLEQAFVKDPDKTVGELIGAAKATVAGFERFKLGQDAVEADAG
jgi:elongation factor Ts